MRITFPMNAVVVPILVSRRNSAIPIRRYEASSARAFSSDEVGFISWLHPIPEHWNHAGVTGMSVISRDNSFMKKTALLLAGVSLLAARASVQAEASLFITDGVNSITVTDGSANDSSPLVGVITYNGLLDASSPWSINVTTGISKPNLGSDLIPFMDLSSVNVSSSRGGTLTVEFSDNNFGPLLPGSFISEIGGSTGGTVGYQTWYDIGNTLFAKTTRTADLDFTSTPFSGYAVADRPADGSVSLTLQTVITHTGNEVTSYDASMYDSTIRPNVPEPGTVSLLALGAVGGLWMLKRSRKNKTA